MRFFLDTYAIVEIMKGNKAYEKYLSEELHTSILNLYELYYNILKEHGEEKAKEYFYIFYSKLVTIKDEHIFYASKIKFRFKKRDISYTDALGYAISEQEGMKFLTGDKEFKDLENVEYVK